MLLGTPICEFGWKAPAFDLPDLDGNRVALEQAKGEKGLLVAFICNHCPYVKAVIDRLVADVKVLQEEGFGVVAIMPNDYRSYPADSPEKMKAFAAEHGFTFPYLLDAEQSVAKAYDAVCTPDFFGFNKDLELQYRGRLDDGRMEAPTSGRRELLEAMRLVADTGKGPQEQTASMGCSIKWKKT